jgi:hypothetical protein
MLNQILWLPWVLYWQDTKLHDIESLKSCRHHLTKEEGWRSVKRVPTVPTTVSMLWMIQTCSDEWRLNAYHRLITRLSQVMKSQQVRSRLCNCYAVFFHLAIPGRLEVLKPPLTLKTRNLQIYPMASFYSPHFYPIESENHS